MTNKQSSREDMKQEPTTPEVEKWEKLDDTIIKILAGPAKGSATDWQRLQKIKKLILEAEARGASKERSRIEGIAKKKIEEIKDDLKKGDYLWQSEFERDRIENFILNDILSAIATPTQKDKQ